MYNLQELLNALPPMLAGKELMDAMTVLPEYSKNVRWELDAIRLMALSDIYKVHVPSQMSQEIYSKLYLALLRSLQKKTTITAVKQQNEHFKAIRQHEYTGILGGSDSFTIIGTSGIGKSSTISRAISLISCNGIIEVQEPYSRIIPCLVVQCPFDSSVKALLLENSDYVPFILIENRFKGQELSKVYAMKSEQRQLVKKASEANLQAQINLAEHIETIVENANSFGDVKLKSVRTTRSKERIRTHVDMKGCGIIV